MGKHILAIFCLLSLMVLGGCGQKGDLYLPSDNTSEKSQ